MTAAATSIPIQREPELAAERLPAPRTRLDAHRPPRSHGGRSSRHGRHGPRSPAYRAADRRDAHGPTINGKLLPGASADWRAWLDEDVFVSVGERQPSGVVYETYLVQ